MFVACAVVAAALQHLLGPMGLSRCPCTCQHQVSCTVCAAFLLLGHTCVPQWCQPLSASCQNRGDKSKPFQCPGQLESKCTVGRAAAARWHAIWQYQNLPRVCFFCLFVWPVARCGLFRVALSATRVMGGQRLLWQRSAGVWLAGCAVAALLAAKNKLWRFNSV